MAFCCRLCLPAGSRISNLKFSTSCLVYNKWRREQGLEPNPRTFGPLTNLPDYSFVDGRPAILTYHKLKKLKYQEEICKKIVTLTAEVDKSLHLYNEKKEAKRIQRENKIKRKLKPKGAALLSKDTSNNNS